MNPKFSDGNKKPLNLSMKVSLCLRKFNQFSHLTGGPLRIKQNRVLFSVKLAREFNLFYARKVCVPLMKNSAKNPFSRL